MFIKNFLPVSKIADKVVFFLLAASVFTNAFSISITSALVIAAVVLYSLTLPWLRNYPRIDRRLLLALALYFLAQLVCSAFAIYPGYSFIWSIKYIILYSLQFFIICACVRSEVRFRLLVAAWAAGILAVDVNVVGNYVLYGLGRKSVRQLLEVSIVQLPDWLNCLLWPWLLAMFFVADKKHKKLFQAFLIILTVFALVVNGGRAAWIAVVLQTLFFFLLLRRYRAVWVTAGTVVVLTGLALQLPKIGERLSLFTDVHARTNVNRLMLWQYSFDIARDFPLAGIGNGLTFKIVFNKFYTHGFNFKEQIAHAHNVFIGRLTETGIAGLLAFVFFIGTFIGKAWKLFQKSARQNLSVLAGLLSVCGWLVMGLFDYSIHLTQVSRAFWIVCGLLLVHPEFQRLKADENNKC